MAAAVKLVNGDLVKLNSDSPWLTVTKDKPEAGSKFVEVAWFDGSALNKDVLPKDALTPHQSVVDRASAKAATAAPAAE